MYRVLLHEGQIECDRFERTENGIDCYIDDKLAAFVPYQNCCGVLDEELVVVEDELAVW
ncbi:hypothetical protein [Haloarchaeobius sp. TZWWS8]|uniref:hypothetical protein n=1 Tax=Haloarchaeobius sp. TZWWS8 TaxID=3446121 RepID=UPI003EBB5E31